MVYTQKIRREILVECAYELVEREGVEALSMRRLAQIVDVRASSLYHHFPEKSALLSAVAEQGLFHLAAALERASTLVSSDPRRQIYAMGMTYREWGLQHSHLYRLLFAGTPPIEDASSASPSATVAPVLAATEVLVGASQATAAAQAIWAFVHGFVMLELTGHMQQCLPVEGFQLGLACFVQGLGR
ncbi:TetR/AcrR family transcriptional regulator [Ktedonospora formicarum]|uniref:TetR family transcriptional regulator n=1 Tax=Ktedonospora formicarum TaxID=2778364 RepID=A0A8J3HRQ4_9CHLR|nr:TetR/AcrR family transcriptional regulator [Ktedonospora formicarum]GHO42051.1 TetR family transcriptional regulator [Ktedonospora formicarum]